MAAGVTASAGGAAADLLTDLKSGYILGANPRKQFIAQFVGIFFGLAAIVPAWYAMVPTKQALEAFNPPATYMWKAVADLLTQGIHMLPVTADLGHRHRRAGGRGAAGGRETLPESRALPALGHGPGPFVGDGVREQPLLRHRGGAGGPWKRLSKKGAEHYYVPVASGMIAGESLIAALIAIACTVAGLLAVR